MNFKKRYLYQSLNHGDIEVEASNGREAMRVAYRHCREASMDPSRLLTWHGDYWVEEGLGNPDDYEDEKTSR